MQFFLDVWKPGGSPWRATHLGIRTGVCPGPRLFCSWTVYLRSVGELRPASETGPHHVRRRSGTISQVARLPFPILTSNEG